MLGAIERNTLPSGSTANSSAPRARWATVHRLLEDERVRFVVVGGFNTAFGYGLFIALELLGGARANYFVSLYGAFLLSTTTAFILHRRFTYRRTGTGSIWLDFVRFQGVYLVSLAINSAALPLLVEKLHFTPIAAQGVVVLVTTATSYFGHKYFSFRRKPDASSTTSGGC